MCVAAVAWNAHPRWRLVVAANRDEFHERPSAPLARWHDLPEVVAGRDLRSGGTWLGVSEAGRFVLVTNHRVPGFPKPDRPSRGGLVTGLLTGEHNLRLVPVDSYNPFNLIHADVSGLRLLGNYPAEFRTSLSPGIHGLSNGVIAPAWPKTRALEDALAAWLDRASDDFTPLFTALRREVPRPQDVPADAPPGAHPEPRFAPVFINDPVYGTRASTVVAVDRNGAGTIIERRFTPAGETSGETAFTFRWPADTTPAHSTAPGCGD